MINGTIANIVPLSQYNSQNGLIYTFTMTINSQNGAVTGEIGSKSNTYPMALGESIAVETRQDAHGTKFKKINPQYPHIGVVLGLAYRLASQRAVRGLVGRSVRLLAGIEG